MTLSTPAQREAWAEPPGGLLGRIKSLVDAVLASAPSTYALAVVPHNANALPAIPRALYVGTAGDVTMRGVGGQADQLWKNVPAGTTIPFRAQYVRASGTTAANILALY